MLILSDDTKDGDEDQCLFTEFRCATGVCIPEAWRCDYQADCLGGEDELEEYCGEFGSLGKL